jgi:hypothetical protein
MTTELTFSQLCTVRASADLCAHQGALAIDLVVVTARRKDHPEEKVICTTLKRVQVEVGLLALVRACKIQVLTLGFVDRDGAGAMFRLVTVTHDRVCEQNSPIALFAPGFEGFSHPCFAPPGSPRDVTDADTAFRPLRRFLAASPMPT